jgi:hypothetical protein
MTIPSRVRPCLAIAGGLLVIAALAGCSDDTTPRADDVAPRSAERTEAARQLAESTADASARPTHAPITAKGAHGRTYSCPFSVGGRLDASNAKVQRRKKVLRARRAPLRRIERRYRHGGAPAAVVDRYESLRARYNAQVVWTNKAIREHNRLLRKECSPK